MVITKSTKIIDVTGKEPVEYRGFVPERKVVIPGSYEKEVCQFHVLLLTQRNLMLNVS